MQMHALYILKCMFHAHTLLYQSVDKKHACIKPGYKHYVMQVIQQSKGPQNLQTIQNNS